MSWAAEQLERRPMRQKLMTPAAVVAELRSGMTIGIGGWGSRRKPMTLVRAICRSDVTDLTIVAYGGPDVGLLLAAGKVRKLVYGFVSLDSIALEPHFRAARQSGAIEVAEYDEGMLQWGLYAASCRLPFLPTRAGLGSDVLRVNPDLRTVQSPYDGEELLAMPALHLDAAIVHASRADAFGNAQFLGPDPYFDDLFCTAARRAYVSCEKVVPTPELTATAPVQTLRIQRWMVAGVVEARARSALHVLRPRLRPGRGVPARVRGRRRRSGRVGGLSRQLSRSGRSRISGIRRGPARRRAGCVMTAAATRADVCVVACAEAWRGDGEMLASPIGLIPTIGARLARATFAARSAAHRR